MSVDHQSLPNETKKNSVIVRDGMGFSKTHRNAAGVWFSSKVLQYFLQLF